MLIRKEALCQVSFTATLPYFTYLGYREIDYGQGDREFGLRNVEYGEVLLAKLYLIWLNGMKCVPNCLCCSRM